MKKTLLAIVLIIEIITLILFGYSLIKFAKTHDPYHGIWAALFALSAFKAPTKVKVTVGERE